MAKKKEEKQEVEIEEFFDNLRKQIKVCQNTVNQIEKQIEQYVELANMINLDRKTYNLKYYFVKEGMIYERRDKKKIGFMD